VEGALVQLYLIPLDFGTYCPQPKRGGRQSKGPWYSLTSYHWGLWYILPPAQEGRQEEEGALVQPYLISLDSSTYCPQPKRGGRERRGPSTALPRPWDSGTYCH